MRQTKSTVNKMAGKVNLTKKCRQQALKDGDSLYYGIECKKCGRNVRRVYDYTCLRCSRAASSNRNHSDVSETSKMTDIDSKIADMELAKELSSFDSFDFDD